MCVGRSRISLDTVVWKHQTIASAIGAVICAQCTPHFVQIESEEVFAANVDHTREVIRLLNSIETELLSTTDGMVSCIVMREVRLRAPEHRVCVRPVKIPVFIVSVYGPSLSKHH